MANSNILNKSLAIGIGLLVLFLLGSTLIMPQFSSAWRYCQEVKWTGANAGVTTNCTYDDDPAHFNNSMINVSTTYTYTRSGVGTYDIDATADGASSLCLGCLTAGGWRTSTQGLLLLVLVAALVTFALYFFKRR